MGELDCAAVGRVDVPVIVSRNLGVVNLEHRPVLALRGGRREDEESAHASTEQARNSAPRVRSSHPCASEEHVEVVERLPGRVLHRRGEGHRVERPLRLVVRVLFAARQKKEEVVCARALSGFSLLLPGASARARARTGCW